jgi:exodeoxyribonuclease V gamma subunit
MLHLHRCDRADRLVDDLAEVLRVPSADPFTRELVAVPTRGMERWLTQRLSATLGSSPGHSDGICAGVDFPFPGRLLADAASRATGIDPDEDPWLPERLVWPLLEVTERLLTEPWLAPLARHLEEGRERRFARLRHLAWLYDQYGARRPQMLEAWARGEGDGWQPELWRELRAELAMPSPAERLPDACERLTAEPELVDLPQRLTLFGLTSLPIARVKLLAAIAAHRDLHLMLLHPSPALWDAVAATPATVGPRASDPTARLAHNRLLGSWGRDARELQVVLASTQPALASTGLLASTSATAPGTPPPDTLLAVLQADIRADRQPPGPPLSGAEERIVLSVNDDSLRIHACHGRARQVEVLREAILHRLASDATLEPRDVIVMCPDVEEFAPLIQATFGVATAEDGELRVRIADRALRQTNPLLALVARLLDLAGARITTSQVLDLIDTAPVRRRFGFSDDDLAQLRDWVAEASIHWGLDGAHRAAFRMEQVEAGTWRAGLDRLLLAVAMADGSPSTWSMVTPAGEVDSGSIRLAGALAELIERLTRVVDALSTAHDLPGWAEALSDAADMLGASAERDAWQRQELARVLDDVVAESSGRKIELAPAEIRALLGERLHGRPTRANFRTGHLTVCTLTPMRSVPHRVVCLLGLDDRAFPRHSPRDGENLLLDEPFVGDRDPRSEDRQLLLDALLAARDSVLITYSGNDERTNAPLPPAVPVGELLEMVDATARVEADLATRARELVLVRHPLQPFDPRNFIDGRIRENGPWSFDEVSLIGAETIQSGARTPPPPFLPGPLAPVIDTGTVSLDELVAFAERPPRAFLRQRLGISVGRWDDELSDGLPVSLDPLERWGVGQRLLDAVLAGAGVRDAMLAEIARGTLPPGGLGKPVLDAVWLDLKEVIAQAQRYATGEPRTLETNTTFAPEVFGAPGGTRLTGTVPGLYGHTALTVSYSRLRPQHRLASWVRLLALTAAHPDLPWEAVTIGRSAERGFAVSIARIPALVGRDAAAREQTARRELEALIRLRFAGLREPLPLPPKSAGAWAIAELQTAQDPDAAARKQWDSTWNFDGEGREPEHEITFGGELPLAGIQRHASSLWQPLLTHETVEDR